MSIHLTTAKTAEMLGVSTQTVDNYRKKGLLPAFRYMQRGRWMFQLIDVIRFKEGREM